MQKRKQGQPHKGWKDSAKATHRTPKTDTEDHMRCCGTIEPQYNCPETVATQEK
jgi:hypothetical protein